MSEAVLIDCSPEALSLAKENATALDISATFELSHLFQKVSGNFDLIVANLPYIAEGECNELEPELAHEPALALYSGSDGRDLLREFIAEVSPYLNEGGLLALEVGYDQGAWVQDTLQNVGLYDCELLPDLSEVFRFPFARKIATTL